MRRPRLLSERRALECLCAGGMLADQNGQVFVYTRADARSLVRGVLPRHILERLKQDGQVRPMPGAYGRYLIWRADAVKRLSRAAPPCPPVGQASAPSLLEAALALTPESVRPRLRAAAGRFRDDVTQSAAPLSQGRDAVATLTEMEARLGTQHMRDLEATIIDRGSLPAAAWRQETTQNDIARQISTRLTRLGEHYALISA